MRHLNVHKIVKDLNDLCNTLIEEYDINSGGCCFVAYVIAKQLDKLHIKYSLQVSDYYPKDEVAINREVRNKKRNACDTFSVTGFNTCSHYYLKVEGGGNVNQDECPSEETVYTITGINHSNIGWIYKNGSWNSQYSKRNNKLIKKIISSHFKQYEKSYKTKVCA